VNFASVGTAARRECPDGFARVGGVDIIRSNERRVHDPVIRVPVVHLLRPQRAIWSCLGPALGVSHTSLQKLVWEFTADPSQMWRLQAAMRDPKFAEISRADDCTEQMKERGELRTSGEANLTRYLRSW